ncbi:hypothetical protein [Actinomadura sp. 3N508]
MAALHTILDCDAASPAALPHVQDLLDAQPPGSRIAPGRGHAPPPAGR